MNGIFTALLTAFNADYSINEKATAELVEFNLSNGINGFYVGGSTGEGMLMSTEERKQVFRIVKDAAGSRVPLIAHVGAISTDAAVDMAECAKELGYDAVSAVAPFYYGFPPETIVKYYKDIADAAKLPVFIYNFPASGSFTFTPAFAAELFEDKRFAGIKHTSANLYDLQQFKAVIGRDITVFNGYDEMCLAGLSMGADGAIGSTYNFMGNKFVKLYDAFRRSDMETASVLQNEANEIIAEMIKYGVFQCEKEVVSCLGIKMGPCRRPFLPLSEEGKSAMKNVAKKLL